MLRRSKISLPRYAEKILTDRTPIEDRRLRYEDVGARLVGEINDEIGA